MEQNKKPVEQYYYSEEEWDRLGCGPLPAIRNRSILNIPTNARLSFRVVRYIKYQATLVYIKLVDKIGKIVV